LALSTQRSLTMYAPIRICQLGNAGELPEEVVNLPLSVDKGLRIIPRTVQMRNDYNG
jgi:hypothetical protein